MLLKFPPHCQARIYERAISVSDIKDALRKPDSTKVAFEGRICATKRIGEKTIEVVYYKDAFRDRKNEYIVITAYYL